MARYLIPLVLFLGMVTFLYVGLQRDPRLVPSPLVGKPSPEFELESLKSAERVMTATSLQGKPALLNVWATWCAACRIEHDFLMWLARSDVRIFGVNYKDERTAALQWLSQLGDPYEASVYDPDGLLSLDLGVYGAPETFMLDRDGTIVYKHIGPLTNMVWEQDLLPLWESLQ